MSRSSAYVVGSQLCISIAQFQHRTEMRLRSNLAGGGDMKVRPLNDAKVRVHTHRQSQMAQMHFLKDSFFSWPRLSFWVKRIVAGAVVQVCMTGWTKKLTNCASGLMSSPIALLPRDTFRLRTAHGPPSISVCWITTMSRSSAQSLISGSSQKRTAGHRLLKNGLKNYDKHLRQDPTMTLQVRLPSRPQARIPQSSTMNGCDSPAPAPTTASTEPAATPATAEAAATATATRRHARDVCPLRPHAQQAAAEE